jgi:glutaredoxin 3
MKKITIYSTPNCHFCHMAKDFFKEQNLEYTDHDVSQDPAKRAELIEKSHQMGVPVILIDDEMIIGFNKPKVEEALGL